MTEQLTKFCNRCHETLSLDMFYTRVGYKGKTVVVGRCKPCMRLDSNERYAANPRWEPPYMRHGMTEQQYLDMREAQGGTCGNPACTNIPDVIDHDHECCPGKKSCGLCVRGLLCDGCNKAEGLLNSDVSKMVGLAEYLSARRDLPA